MSFILLWLQLTTGKPVTKLLVWNFFFVWTAIPESNGVAYIGHDTLCCLCKQLYWWIETLICLTHVTNDWKTQLKSQQCNAIESDQSMSTHHRIHGERSSFEDVHHKIKVNICCFTWIKEHVSMCPSFRTSLLLSGVCQISWAVIWVRKSSRR